ncbi:MAG: hypothetical protein J5I98_18195 [Phaeodactylibacter sp.]|nr:hypothetical protein [Phaeodactylibacter sp.]
MMRPIHYERYIREAALKTRRIGFFLALLAIIAIPSFYLLDINDLGLERTLPWRGIGLAGALAFLLGRYFIRSPQFIIYIHAFMLSCLILMMSAIAWLIFTNPDGTPKQEFAVTVGCMTVWPVVAITAGGARRYMAYIGIATMGVLGVLLLAGNADSFGYIFSIYLTAFFAIIIMLFQERQEREKSNFVYQLEEREEKIARQRQELQNANDNLVSFNYAITHDLKGPLRLAQSFTQLLERRFHAGELDEQSAREFFGQVKNSHDKIYQILEGLLLLSRIGKGGMEVTTVEVEPLVRSVWEEQTAGRPEGKKPELALKGLNTVQADSKLLWHVLANLASNAVKYSQYAAAPRVEIGSYQDQGQTVLYVRDNGVGFDMKFAADLGKPFKRLHSAHQFEGAGVGLAIVQQVATLHGGRFWAESAEGKGATFYCSFPRRLKSG